MAANSNSNWEPAHTDAAGSLERQQHQRQQQQQQQHGSNIARTAATSGLTLPQQL